MLAFNYAYMCVMHILWSKRSLASKSRRVSDILCTSHSEIEARPGPKEPFGLFWRIANVTFVPIYHEEFHSDVVMLEIKYHPHRSSSVPPAGNAFDALHSLQSILKGRPKSFKSMDDVIEWRSVALRLSVGAC